jgi:lipid A disaccharide synthetase
VEELVQQQVNPQDIARKTIALLQQDAAHQVLLHEYNKIHESLRRGADTRAAQAVLALL